MTIILLELITRSNIVIYCWNVVIYYTWLVVSYISELVVIPAVNDNITAVVYHKE